MNNWPDTAFNRGPLDAVDEKRNAKALQVVQQWQDGAIMFLEMVGALELLLDVEDYKARDEMTGDKRTHFDWQVWPDQTCECCKYVATIASALDVWVCEGHRTDTWSLIVRYGPQPHEYASCPFTQEDFEKELEAKKRRYAGRIEEEATRRHAIIEMVIEHLPSTILNMSSFPGKVMVTMARSAAILNKKGGE